MSLKSVQWTPSSSMRADGGTDVSNLIVAFRNFANAPKNCSYIYIFLPYVSLFLPNHYWCSGLLLPVITRN